MPIRLGKVTFENRIGAAVEVFASHGQYHHLQVDERTLAISGTLYTIDVSCAEGKQSYDFVRYRPDTLLLAEDCPYTIHQSYSDGLLLLHIRDHKGMKRVEIAPAP